MQSKLRSITTALASLCLVLPFLEDLPELDFQGKCCLRKRGSLVARNIGGTVGPGPCTDPEP